MTAKRTIGGESFPVLLTSILALALALLSSCGGRARAAQAKKPLVAVSILPQSWFVERIAGDTVEVLTLVGPGQSPHSYDPSPRQVEALSRAIAWFRVGVEFEEGLSTRIPALSPDMLVADCSAGMTFRKLSEAHSHEEEGPLDEDRAHEEEAGADRDPHVWLGRSQAKVMALNIASTLATLDPEASMAYHQAAAELIQEIDAIFDGLAAALEPLRGSPVFVFHPSFGYFLDEFGMEQVAVEVGGKEPSQRQLGELVEKAKASGARVVFVQAQFSDRAARAVAQSIGGTVAALDPLAQDWPGNLKAMGEALASALPAEGESGR